MNKRNHSRKGPIGTDRRSENAGRPPEDELTDLLEKGVDPPTDEQLLPKPLLVQAAGSVTLPDWDLEGHLLKDQINGLFRQISNRRRENGMATGEYLVLSCQTLPDNNSRPSSIYARRYGVGRCTLGDAYEVIRADQGITARDLTLKLFADAPAPPQLEPRVRSMLYRIKDKGWANSRYDDRGIQRWYAVDIDVPPEDWDARARAISYVLVDLWGGKPRDYVRQVEALTELMDKQGPRVADPAAWIHERESPF